MTSKFLNSGKLLTFDMFDARPGEDTVADGARQASHDPPHQLALG
jgi:hypothetical protein